MAAITIDSLSIAKRLKTHGFTDDQAEAIATEIQEVAREDHLVTVGQLDNRIEKLELRIESRIESIKSDIFKWIVPLMLGQAALIAALVKLL